MIKCLSTIFTVLLTFPHGLDCNSDISLDDFSKLAVKAVFIKCETTEEAPLSESETTRFQREELFRHNALRDCKEKLAVTIKMTNDPNQSSEDEYVPIEHVLGPNRKRIRLLKPYVLRLRRLAPFQAYKLRKVETVRGAIANPYDRSWIGVTNNESGRVKREVKSNNKLEEDLHNSLAFNNDKLGRRSHSPRVQDSNLQLFNTASESTVAFGEDFDNVCYKHNDSVNKKSYFKRQTQMYGNSYLPGWTTSDLSPPLEIDDNRHEKSSLIINQEKSLNLPYKERKAVFSNSDYETSEYLSEYGQKATNMINLDGSAYNNEGKKAHSSVNTHTITDSDDLNTNKIEKKNLLLNNKHANNDREYAVYEIGDPVVWFTARVQIYEKLSTPTGKTLWNDLTKDEKASVSTTRSEWSNQDVHIHYKPADYLARTDFTLPLRGLCLLVPLKDYNGDEHFSVDKSGDFVIVPTEDVVTLNDAKEFIKRDENSSNTNNASSAESRQRYRRVVVRTVRAIMGGSTDSLKLVTRGAHKYLKLPHTKPHNAQIDVEARADDNELVLVGKLGRLTTLVSDSTRRTRSVLTVQATNTGLAAARYRVCLRDCSPEILAGRVKTGDTISGAELLPPRHSQNFQFNLPIESSFNTANCIVSLLNEGGESVAVRDVRIKRSDRCFCVWHCDCVCLGEDPKLLCHDMTPTQVTAAGLSTQKKFRYSRSACYPDLVTLNVFVSFIGVLFTLLLLGFIKAILGLILSCVGSWGLHLLLQSPRKLDHYYECSLRNRRVIYDGEGWPVHPDTKERTVRLVSQPVEFVLNLIFFISLPCLMLWDAMKKVGTSCQGVAENSNPIHRQNDHKNFFSTHDVQDMEARYRRRRGGHHRWMTPEAERLTTGIWKEGLRPGTKSGDCLQPLLRGEKCFRSTCDQSSGAGSEDDDTEYVLMQMKKSRESLAKSQLHFGCDNQRKENINSGSIIR